MALSAIATQTFTMNIIGFMAIVAGLIFDRTVDIGEMALLAARCLMPSSQREICLAVIKLIFAPTGVVMALLTFFPIFTKMHVIMLMTTVACFG